MDELHFRISNLIYKSIIGDLEDDSEIAELNNWRQESEENEKLYQKLSSIDNIEEYKERINYFSSEDGWKKFQKNNKKKRFFTFYKSFAKYAAIIILVICSSIVGYWLYSEKKIPVAIVEETKQNNILPGKSKAILTLPSGVELQLKSDSVLSASEISVLDSESSLSNKDKTLSYSMIEIPRGGEYNLVLSDGTNVYLNSETKLRFPDKFAEDKREIELIGGEIYLDVKRNDQSPFYIKTDDITVKVLGTSFNISTYGNLYQTTLVNGSVEVKVGEGKAYKLKPSQQINYVKDKEKIDIKYVDTDLYTSWINGKIVFRDQSLENILNSLSRWYNFDVRYESEDLKFYEFGINVNKYESIDPLLNILESTGKFGFEIHDNVIYVKKNNNQQKQ